MIDLNLNPTEGNIRFVSDENIIDNPVALFFQELDMCMNLDRWDFYMRPFVIDLKKYVFSKNISNNTIASQIRQFVLDNCAHAVYHTWDIEVNIVQGNDNRDILYIVFDVHVDGEVFTNQFVISI